jgi:hypothetical protein
MKEILKDFGIKQLFIDDCCECKKQLGRNIMLHIFINFDKELIIESSFYCDQCIKKIFHI